MHLACTLFGFTVEETLQAVTIQAAKALGIHSSVGSLEVGKIANLAVWEVSDVREIIYHLGLNQCKQVL